MANEQDERYALSEAEGELERLRKQHALYMIGSNHRIVYAPVDLKKPGLRVLDVGCADGLLLRDLQKQTAQDAELVGIDITEAFLPKNAEDNIRYIVGNMQQPYEEELREHFDLAHVRTSMASAVKEGIDKAVLYLTETLKPGGWLQILEPDFRDGQYPKGSALAHVATLVAAVLGLASATPEYVIDLEPAFKKAGLTNISVQELLFPIGKKTGNEEDARVTTDAWQSTIDLLTMVTSAASVGLPPSTTENLGERYRDEMAREGDYLHAMVIIGQKASEK